MVGGPLMLAMWLVAPSVFRTGDVSAQSPTRLSFTEDQAEQGSADYAERCASCHGDNLDDGEVAPPLKGVDFRERWRAESPETLFLLTSDTMPQDQPGALDDATYAALLAYIY